MASIIIKEDSGLRTQDSGTIYALMGGRLGNQLFEYAFVKALKTKFHPNYKIKVNYYNFQNLTEAQKFEEYENSLSFFNIKDIEYINEPPIRTVNFLQLAFMGGSKIIHKILPKDFMFFIDEHIFQPVFSRCGLYNALLVVPTPCRSLSKRIFYHSTRWSVSHFNFIRDTLLDYFTPINDPLPNNLKILNDIVTSESVCVHIRRGDFLNSDLVSTFNVCNEEYFVTAMKAVHEEIPNCKFFVFSDDVDYVKHKISFPFNVTYDEGSNPAYETLRLMYSCKHFIISNSTFSWWAQYLSRNPNKIVYAPTPWLWGFWGRGQCENLYPPYIRTIQCHR